MTTSKRITIVVPVDLYSKVLVALSIFGFNSVSSFFVYAARRLLEERGLLPLLATKAPLRGPQGGECGAVGPDSAKMRAMLEKAGGEGVEGR